MNRLIKNGTIITANDIFNADIRICNEKITEIASSLKPDSGEEVIDAKNNFVFPGGIDPHVHLDMPFMGTTSADDFETGTRAAAAGGTTSLIDFAIQEKGQTLKETLAIWKKKAETKALVDYSHHVAITDYNDYIEREIPEVIKMGFKSFKCFMAYKGALMVDDSQLFRIIEQTKKHNALLTIHCENGEVVALLQKNFIASNFTSPKYHPLSRPALIEGEATGRAFDLARYHDWPVYIVHMTCEESVSRLISARSRGQVVYGETCIQYLLLDDSVYEKPDYEGAKFVMSPPIRKKKDQDYLWDALKLGHLSVVSTDHCPFDFKKKKEMGKNNFCLIPNGAPIVQHRLNLLYTYGVTTKKINLNKFVELSSTNAAKLFGMFPAKGTIAVGSDADIAIFNPKKEWLISAKNHFHNCDYALFEGWKVKGEFVEVLSRGETVFKDGKPMGKPGRGRYLVRTPFGDAYNSTLPS